MFEGVGLCRKTNRTKADGRRWSYKFWYTRWPVLKQLAWNSPHAFHWLLEVVCKVGIFSIFMDTMNACSIIWVGKQSGAQRFEMNIPHNCVYFLLGLWLANELFVFGKSQKFPLKGIVNICIIFIMTFSCGQQVSVETLAEDLEETWKLLKQRYCRLAIGEEDHCVLCKWSSWTALIKLRRSKRIGSSAFTHRRTLSSCCPACSWSPHFVLEVDQFKNCLKRPSFVWHDDLRLRS